MSKLPLVLVSLSTLALVACGPGSGSPDARPFADARETVDAMGGPDAAGNVNGGTDDAATDDASVADATTPDATADATPPDDAPPDATPTPDADATLAPMVASLDYTTAPRLGLLTVNGSGFVGATDVTLGGTSQPFTVVSDSVITLDGIDAATTLGNDDLIVVEGASSSTAVQVDVIDLAVTPSVVAVGSHPVVASTTFSFDSATTTVSIAGVSQTTGTVNTTDFDITGVAGVTAGSLPLLISSNGTDIAPLPIPVADLVINEVDPNQVGADTAEFVEIATGLPNTAVTGYVLVLWNGGGPNDPSYRSLPIDGTTDANGLLLAGNAGVTPAPPVAMQWPDSTLQQGPDAVSINQGTTSDFPNGTEAGSPPTGTFLIDALVYGGSADAALVAALLGTGPEAVMVDEDANNMDTTESISRCTAGRLDDRNFVVGTPTPGAGNICP